MQALALMLCAGVYLLAHRVWKGVRVPAGQEGQVTLVCCGYPMKEEKREKLATRLSKIKSRCDSCAQLACGELRICVRMSGAMGFKSLSDLMHLHFLPVSQSNLCIVLC